LSKAASCKTESQPEVKEERQEQQEFGKVKAEEPVINLSNSDCSQHAVTPRRSTCINDIIDLSQMMVVQHHPLPALDQQLQHVSTLLVSPLQMMAVHPLPLLSINQRLSLLFGTQPTLMPSLIYQIQMMVAHPPQLLVVHQQLPPRFLP
jgi:hypothetical protein